jgi:hypothetical protein
MATNKPIDAGDIADVTKSGDVLLASADALLRALEADEQTGGHEGVTDITEWWYDDGPRMQPLAAEPIAAAAICQAMFGKEIVPEVSQDGTGDLCREALQIASVFISASPVARGAFLALALAVQQRAEEAEGNTNA